jgi:4-amino-4-deoxy-L-arabinose transferase-like glycosyltransferase
MSRASRVGSAPAAVAERTFSWGTLAVFGFALATLVAPAFGNGVWDPYELRSLELARRIALGLFGAADFALPGAENALPSRGVLDRGELPFTSMALGLKLFGLHPFAARVALLAWALVALCAGYLLVRRLAGRGPARLSVLLLAATPLFFVHARTLLGDGVTQAALALALAGLTLALFDDGSRRLRAGFFLLGCLGLLLGGLSRGLLLGVAVPALGPAGAWLVQRLAGTGRSDRLTTAAGSSLLAIGTAASVAGALVLAQAVAEPQRYFALLGFGVVRGTTRPTFDALLHALGHGLFPLSALLPVALGRLLLAPLAAEDSARERETGLRLSVLLTATLGFGMGGLLADSAGVVPFGPVAALAIAGALALADLDRGAPASPAAGLIVAALLALFLLDFRNSPEQLLRVFAVDSARFPESFQAPGARWLIAGTAVAAIATLLAFLERDEPDKRAFALDDFLAWPRTLRDLWNGNLMFGACVVEAALLGFFAFDLLGERFPAFQRFAAGSELTRLLNRVAWLALPSLFVLPFLVLAARDALRWLARVRDGGGFGVLVPRRGSLAACGFVACGTGLGVGYYPGLAAQLSPQDAFEEFRARARPGEAIGVVGSSAAAGFYAAGRGTTVFETAEAGYDWLVEPGARRFLVFGSNALAGLNARFRELAEPRRNLPVLSARSSEILLASNRLEAGERNENPLERFLPSVLPKLTRPLDANLGGQLDVPGWDVLDLEGRSVASVRPGRRYEFVVYFRVVARVTGTWDTFVHIDGFQRRFNADHTTLDGAYPFSFWNAGDLIADRREFVLEPNFGAGEYRVYLGLYSGSRRMPVQRGAHSDDRLEAGTLVID